MAENQFDWVEFYSAFAHELLKYKDNRKELIKKIEKIYEITDIKMPTLERDRKLVDIDPFTIFGLFNKGLTIDNRLKHYLNYLMYLRLFQHLLIVFQ